MPPPSTGVSSKKMGPVVSSILYKRGGDSSLTINLSLEPRCLNTFSNLVIMEEVGLVFASVNLHLSISEIIVLYSSSISCGVNHDSTSICC
ncbi:MAG: hypothetical protein ACXAEX_24175 [Promethearchaeota archaeon]